MIAVGQRSESHSESRFLTIAVAAALVMLAGLMVLLNADEAGLSLLAIPLGLLAIGFMIAWRATPIASLLGLAMITLVWALLDMPGSPGVLMIGPLGGLWADRARSLQSCLLASASAAAVAVLEGVISLINSSGTAVDLVGNLALVVLVASVGAGWRHIRDDLDRPEPISAPVTGDISAELEPAPAWLGELSRREREVLAQLVDGASNKEIAETCISA